MNHQIDIRPRGISRIHYLNLPDLRHVPQSGIAKFGEVVRQDDQQLELSLTSTVLGRKYRYVIDKGSQQAVEWQETDLNGKDLEYGMQTEAIKVAANVFLPRFHLRTSFTNGKPYLLQATWIEDATAPFVPANPAAVECVNGQAGDTIVDFRSNLKSTIVFSAAKDFDDVKLARGAE